MLLGRVKKLYIFTKILFMRIQFYNFIANTTDYVKQLPFLYRGMMATSFLFVS